MSILELVIGFVESIVNRVVFVGDDAPVAYASMDYGCELHGQCFGFENRQITHLSPPFFHPMRMVGRNVGLDTQSADKERQWRFENACEISKRVNVDAYLSRLQFGHRRMRPLPAHSLT